MFLFTWVVGVYTYTLARGGPALSWPPFVESSLYDKYTHTHTQAIRAEGKELELAVGITKMSTADVCVCTYTFSLWCLLAVLCVPHSIE